MVQVEDTFKKVGYDPTANTQTRRAGAAGEYQEEGAPAGGGGGGLPRMDLSTILEKVLTYRRKPFASFFLVWMRIYEITRLDRAIPCAGFAFDPGHVTLQDCLSRLQCTKGKDSWKGRKSAMEEVIQACAK